jgi:solute carrier family 25 (adenine nucleotide translocator) protein 4/5/6/31
MFDSLMGINPYRKEKNMTGLLSKFGIAQTTAITAGYASYPFDTIRRRLQMQSEKPKVGYVYAYKCICYVYAVCMYACITIIDTIILTNYTNNAYIFYDIYIYTSQAEWYYKGTVDCCKKIIADEGTSALFKGAGANALRTVSLYTYTYTYIHS